MCDDCQKLQHRIDELIDDKNLLETRLNIYRSMLQRERDKTVQNEQENKIRSRNT
jgi:hypothetical protein